MKVGLVYTSTTPELIDLVNQEVKKQLGDDAELMNYEDASILSEVREHGYVTTAPAARLITMYMQAARDGADAILNICSSVGEAADCAQALGKYIGVPIVRIDEDMCKAAVCMGKRIGILATLPTTLTPTKNTVLRVARELNKEVTLVDGLIDAFGANQDKFRQLLLEKSKEILPQVDVIVLCQGSMAYCEAYLQEALDIPVVSSPRFGAKALRRALEEKGLI